MSERFSVAYEQVTQDVEKLVALIRESQENQQMFMSEAYRLLQAQSHDVEELQGRAISWELVLKRLDDLMDAINMILSILGQLNIKVDIQQPDETLMPGSSPSMVGTTPGTMGTPTGMTPPKSAATMPGTQAGMQPGTQPCMTPSTGMIPGMSGTAPGMTGTSPSIIGPGASPTTPIFEQAEPHPEIMEPRESSAIFTAAKSESSAF